MKPAWRGLVVFGEVWAWPTVLFDHNDAFAAWDGMRGYTCRWRQWKPGGPIDFDDDPSPEDRLLVAEWVAKNT